MTGIDACANERACPTISVFGSATDDDSLLLFSTVSSSLVSTVILEGGDL